MKWKLLAVFAIFILTACGKNNFKTTPQIKIKSLNGNLVPFQGVLEITVEATDKEGDLSQGKIIYYPKLLNVRRLAATSTNYIPITQDIPEFPNNSKSDVVLRLKREFLYKDVTFRQGVDKDKNDTIAIRIVVEDKAGNKSDTATTESIVILGQ